MGNYSSAFEYYRTKSFTLRDEIERIADEAYTERIQLIN